MFYGQNYFSEKSDVFSMGMFVLFVFTLIVIFRVLWELCTRVITGRYRAPYAELNLKLDFQILYQTAEKVLFLCNYK